NNSYYNAVLADPTYQSTSGKLETLLTNIAGTRPELAIVEGKPFSEWFANQAIFDRTPESGDQLHTVNMTGTSIELRYFNRTTGGSESAKASQPVSIDLYYYNANGDFISQHYSRTTDSVGMVTLSPYDELPPGYSGKIKIVATAGSSSHTSYGAHIQNARGVFGTITNQRDGTVTVTPLNNPGDAVTKAITNGAFETPELTGMKGEFSITFTAPNGDTANATILKDLAPYFVELTSSGIEPPAVPALTSPINGSYTNDNTPALSWQNTAGDGGSYTLQIATDSNFTQNLQTISDLTTNTSTLTTALSNTQYYWRVKAKKSTGQESTYSSPYSFTVDIISPTGTIAINSGANLTNSGNVSISNNVAGANNMQFGTDGVNYLPQPAAAFAPSYGMTLPAGDGAKTVYGRFCDLASNCISTQDDITLDTTAPGGSFNINNNATYATAQNVTLVNNISDADSMQFSNDGTSYSPEPATAFNANYDWTLSNGDGQKTVYGRFRDAAGNIYATQDTIMLDTLPPTGLFTIEQGSYTNNHQINLDNSNIIGAQTMRFSNDGGNYSSPVTFSNYYDWTLEDQTEGEKMIYGKYLDPAGNELNIFENIILDKTSPAKPSGIDDGGDTTELSQVTWSWPAATDALSGVSHYLISIGTTPGGSDIISNYNVDSVLNYTRYNLEIDKTYYAGIKAVDQAANQSDAIVSDGITVTATSQNLTDLSHDFTNRGWQMISVPGDTKNYAFESGYFTLYEFDQTAGYKKAGNTLQKGKVYFLKVGDPTTLSIQTDLGEDDELRMPLTAGWNAVGNPYDQGIAMSSIQIVDQGTTYTLQQAIQNGIIGKPLWTVDNSYYQEIPIDDTLNSKTLEPWTGFWIYIGKNCEIVLPKN
ncbi:MAG: hypothetical protein V1843_01995, partial [bacterium]